MGVTARQTTIQLTTPDELRGRMASLSNISARGLSSLGGIELGIVVSFLGASPALAIGGVISLMVSAGVGLW